MSTSANDLKRGSNVAWTNREANETRVLYARPASAEGQHAERVHTKLLHTAAVTALLTIFHGTPAPDKILC